MANDPRDYYLGLGGISTGSTSNRLGQMHARWNQRVPPKPPAVARKKPRHSPSTNRLMLARGCSPPSSGLRSRTDRGVRLGRHGLGTGILSKASSYTPSHGISLRDRGAS